MLKAWRRKQSARWPAKSPRPPATPRPAVKKSERIAKKPGPPKGVDQIQSWFIEGLAIERQVQLLIRTDGLSRDEAVRTTRAATTKAKRYQYETSKHYHKTFLRSYALVDGAVSRRSTGDRV
jgi:hypothetical protein